MAKKTVLLVIGFVIFWNSGFVGAEYGLPYADPYTLLFWRYLGLTLLLWTYLTIRGRFEWVSWKKAKPNLLIGILAHGVWLTCALVAISNDVPAGIVALIISLQPLVTGSISGRITGERNSIQQWLGLSIGFLGVVLSVAYRIDTENSTSMVSYLIPLGSIIAMVMASLLQRNMELNKSVNKLPSGLSLFYQGLGTTVVLFFPAVFFENLATEWTTEFILTQVWLILGVSLIAYTFVWKLIERMSATSFSSLFYLGPPVTMFMAWLMFGDAILVSDILGLIVIVVGLLITQINFKKQFTHFKKTPSIQGLTKTH